ncbi:glycosyltransferase family 2 protein [Roseobacter litoralis]|uniref:glycosyltransferase family 2 protein n=1 Tax=Roseobacter litoralis TaxID=42443 RepID=UPI0024910352|nr:glycosyltransferase [Roseobacter litoralis]
MTDPSSSASDMFSVIIAAHNEEGYITTCLEALRIQDDTAGPLEVIVAANGCTDRTVVLVENQIAAFAHAGHCLICLDLARPSKVGALNAGEMAATGTARAYLDADVLCDPALMGQLRRALATDAPRYATGTLKVVPARSWITRQYARFWQRLPFVQEGAVGAGLFAVNATGRARWAAFPDIISDDTFVRLQFAPAERIEVPARYHWPMIEGWSDLVRVRRRQDRGVAQINEIYPHLQINAAHAVTGLTGLLRLLLQDPVGFTVYLSVHLAVRLRRADNSWTRGR